MAGACLPGCEPLRGRNCAHARRYTKRYIRVHLRSVVWGWIFGTCSASVPHPLAARGLAVAPNAASCRVTMLWQPGFDKDDKGCSSMEFLRSCCFDSVSMFCDFCRPPTQKQSIFFKPFLVFAFAFCHVLGRMKKKHFSVLKKATKIRQKSRLPRSLGGGGARSSRK